MPNLESNNNNKSPARSIYNLLLASKKEFAGNFLVELEQHLDQLIDSINGKFQVTPDTLSDYITAAFLIELNEDEQHRLVELMDPTFVDQILDQLDYTTDSGNQQSAKITPLLMVLPNLAELKSNENIIEVVETFENNDNIVIEDDASNNNNILRDDDNFVTSFFDTLKQAVAEKNIDDIMNACQKFKGNLINRGINNTEEKAELIYDCIKKEQAIITGEHFKHLQQAYQFLEDSDKEGYIAGFLNILALAAGNKIGLLSAEDFKYINDITVFHAGNISKFNEFCDQLNKYIETIDNLNTKIENIKFSQEVNFPVIENFKNIIIKTHKEDKISLAQAASLVFAAEQLLMKHAGLSECDNFLDCLNQNKDIPKEVVAAANRLIVETFNDGVLKDQFCKLTESVLQEQKIINNHLKELKYFLSEGEISQTEHDVTFLKYYTILINNAQLPKAQLSAMLNNARKDIEFTALSNRLKKTIEAHDNGHADITQAQKITATQILKDVKTCRERKVINKHQANQMLCHTNNLLKDESLENLQKFTNAAKPFNKSSLGKKVVAGVMALAGLACFGIAAAIGVASAGVALPASIGFGIVGKCLIAGASMLVGAGLFHGSRKTAESAGKDVGNAEKYKNFGLLANSHVDKDKTEDLAHKICLDEQKKQSKFSA